jgi:hypothetical protein
MAGAVITELLDSWHQGVIAAAEVAWPPSSTAQLGVDQLLAQSTPRAWNNAFAIVAGRAIPRKRDGVVCMNREPATTAAIIGQFPYRYRDEDSGEVTQYHLIVRNDGSLYWMNESGEETLLDEDIFTAGDYFPSFSTLNNLHFICNGEERTKLRGTTIENFGIEAPIITTTTANGGVAGYLNGEYEIAFTYYNENTGHESSRSEILPINVVVVFRKIDILNIPQSPDPQVTHTRVYLRNINRQVNFYRVDEIADGTTSATVDAPLGGDVNLVLIGPDLSENDPPPEGIKYLAAHKNRMFAADDGKLYWSKVGLPEAFDPDAYDFVHQDDGQKITGLASIPGGYLIIFKEDGYYVLEGDTPNIWSISRLGPNVGCLSHRSIVLGSDGLYWWGDDGPVKLTFGSLSSPELIGFNRISAYLTKRHVNRREARRICAAHDQTNQRILFAVPEAQLERNTKMMSWSARLNCWESDRWDPIDAASLTTVNDSNSEPFIMLGGYAGQVFKVGVGGNDGVVTGTTTGSFVALEATLSSITDAIADFDTTGNALLERKVTIVDSNFLPVTKSIRPRVLANTETELTLSGVISGLTPGAVYTYVVGGQDWQFDTAWRDLGQPFDKKRLEFVYTFAMLFGHDAYLDILRNQRGSTLQVERLATIEGSAALWNTFDWNDGTLWNTMEITYERTRGAQTGTTFAARYRNPFANQPMQLLRTGFRAVHLDDKLG